MTNPITPEVRAAIERLRCYYLGPWPVEYTEPGGAMVREQDREQVLRLALSLLQPEMPEPVEMFRVTCDGLPGSQYIYDSAAGAKEFIGCANDMTTYRGLFVPLERVES